jgi:hypothetical protein
VEPILDQITQLVPRASALVVNLGSAVHQFEVDFQKMSSKFYNLKDFSLIWRAAAPIPEWSRFLFARFGDLQRLFISWDTQKMSDILDRVAEGAPRLKVLHLGRTSATAPDQTLESISSPIQKMNNLEQLILARCCIEVSQLEDLVSSISSAGPPLLDLQHKLAQLSGFLPTHPQFTVFCQTKQLPPGATSCIAPLFGYLYALCPTTADYVPMCQYLLNAMRRPDGTSLIDVEASSCSGHPISLRTLPLTLWLLDAFPIYPEKLTALLKAGATPFHHFSVASPQFDHVGNTLHLAISLLPPVIMRELLNCIDLSKLDDIQLSLRSRQGLTPLHVVPRFFDSWKTMLDVVQPLWPDILNDCVNVDGRPATDAILRSCAGGEVFLLAPEDLRILVQSTGASRTFFANVFLYFVSVYQKRIGFGIVDPIAQLVDESFKAHVASFGAAEGLTTSHDYGFSSEDYVYDVAFFMIDQHWKNRADWQQFKQILDQDFGISARASFQSDAMKNFSFF